MQDCIMYVYMFVSFLMQFHPDKLGNTATSSERSAATEKFHRLTHAYQLLTDSVTRHHHDAQTRAREMSEQLIINSVMALSEMSLIEGEYITDCRCGGVYSIATVDVCGTDQEHIVGCTSCSLYIKVIDKSKLN